MGRGFFEGGVMGEGMAGGCFFWGGVVAGGMGGVWRGRGVRVGQDAGGGGGGLGFSSLCGNGNSYCVPVSPAVRVTPEA